MLIMTVLLTLFSLITTILCSGPQYSNMGTARMQRSKHRSILSASDLIGNITSTSKKDCITQCLQTIGCFGANIYIESYMCVMFSETALDNVVDDDECCWHFVLENVFTSRGMYRLAAGNAQGHGRAEYLTTDTGQWGTICDTGFSTGGWPCTFCVHMGYKEASKAKFIKDMTSFPVVDDGYPISYYDFSCGCTSPWQQCTHSNTRCDHNQDVVIWCK